VEGALIAWTAHPARRRPRDVALVVGVTAVTAAAVLESFGSPLLAGLSALFLAVAVAPFLLPSRFVVTDDEIACERALGRRARRFADLRRVEVGPDVILVSPFSRPSWLDRYRGLFVLLDGLDEPRRTELVSLLRSKIP
jgi:hypothetical protein